MADREAERRAFEEQLKAIPPVQIDQSRWPKHVRPINLEETEGLGIDADGRLYWDGRPVEIIGRRLILTRAQTAWAWMVGLAGFLALLGGAAQGWAAGHEWMCKAGWIVTWCGPS